MLRNNLLLNRNEDRICTVCLSYDGAAGPDLLTSQALGVKVIASNEVVMLAKAAGYDSVFIDQEHSILSLEDVSKLCSTSLLVGVTPFVRVPYGCGPGHVQRVLDAGAMGVIFPHVDSVSEAMEAVACTKYPPKGKRSLTAAMPQFYYQKVPAKELMQEIDASGSTVFIMVETRECLENIDAIAAVDGVDVLLLGVNDLTLELGILTEWDNPIFQDALRRVAHAAQQSGKIFGISGLYTRPDICKHAIRELGARFILGHYDIGLLAMGMNKNMEQLREMGYS